MDTSSYPGYKKLGGANTIRNEQAVELIRARKPFRNWSYNFYGFTDVADVYGVFSCGQLVAKVYPDGHYEKAKKMRSTAHRDVIDKALP